MRSAWITVVLCAGALIAHPGAVCIGQTGQTQSTPPKSPNTPDNPTSPSNPAPAKTSTETPTVNQPARGSDPLDERMKRLADRLATGKKAPAAKVFDATNDPAAPPSKSASGDQSPLPVRRHKQDEVNASQANQAKLVDPADLEPLGPRGTVPGSAGSNSKGNVHSGDWVLNLITALGVVLVLVFLLRSSIARWFSKAGATASSPVVEVLTRVSVAPRNHVLLLRVGNRVLIVGDSSAGLRTLGEVDDAEEVADLLTLVASNQATGASGGFRKLLQGFNGEYRSVDQQNEIGNDENEFQVDRTRDRLTGLVGKLRSIAKGGER